MSDTPHDGLELTLTHLAPDATRAGIEFPETRQTAVRPRQFRKLLHSLNGLAAKVEYPAEPAIRIVAPAGRFIVQVKAGRLQFVSWASSQNTPVTPPLDEIVRIVTGEIVEGEVAFEPAAQAAATDKPTRKRWLIGTLLVVVIVGLNAFTLLTARKPPGNFLEDHRLLDAAASERLIESVAGIYETGSKPGDRRLQIGKKGDVQWIKFGADRAVAERREFTVQAAEVAGGKPALLTNRKTLIKVKDAITLTYFGDTYTRPLK